jgi:hypothetical protein
MRPLHGCLLVAALLALGWSVWQLRDLLVPLYGDGGGLGAVSTGFSNDLLAFLAVIPVNLALRRSATRAGVLATRLRRAHLYLTLAYVAAGLATVAAFLTPGTFEQASNDVAMIAILLLVVLGTTFIPVQGFFLFAAIAFTIERVRRRREDGGA